MKVGDRVICPAVPERRSRRSGVVTFAAQAESAGEVLGRTFGDTWSVKCDDGTVRSVRERDLRAE